MKRTTILFVLVAAIAAFAAACSFSTASLASLSTSKDKEGKQAATSFKGGETLYAIATISGSMSKTTTKFKLTADDVPGLKKGETIPGTEVPVELPSSGSAVLTLPIPAGVTSGKYIVVADMLDEKGEKKGEKSVNVTIEGSAAPAAPADSDDDKDADTDTDKKGSDSDKKDDH